MLAFALAFSAVCGAAYMRGDMNGDGIVDTDDAIYLLRHALMPGSYPISQSGDVNGDGLIDTDDAIYLLRHALMPGNYPLKPDKLYSEGLEYTLSADGTYYELSGIGSCTDTDIVIPAEHEGLPVKTIKSQAFNGCKSIESIKIPDGITSIGDRAFYDCTALVSITIPKDVSSIGNEVFVYCLSLESITVEQGNTAYRSTDGNLYSADGKELMQYALGKKDASFTVPDGVTSIRDKAFQACAYLTSVSVPKGVTSIGSYTFNECTSLSSVTLPEGLTSIGKRTFYYCTSLTSVVIPNGVESIGNDAFRNCTLLASVTIPKSVKSIGGYAFANCISLATVNYIGTSDEWESVTKGGYWNYNAGKYTVTLVGPYTSPDLAYTISADGTYYELSGIGSCTDTDIVIPEMYNGLPVAYIKKDAFRGNTKITSVVIPASVKNIGYMAFASCRNMASVKFSEGLEVIEYQAFADCRALESIEIPSTVTSIGGYAFGDCLKLTEITVPANVKLINKGAFAGCYRVTRVTIENGVETIGELAFCDCEGITEIIIPESVKTIGKQAFSECTSLASVTLGNGIETIGDYAFAGLTKLTTINIPASVKTLGEGVFKDCTGLVGVTIENGVEAISVQAFRGCASLATITLPESVKTIGDEAFCACTALVSAVLPDGITSIGNNAFEGCYILESIELPKELETIGYYAFAHCYKIGSITIPEGVTSIGDCAFYWCEGLKTVSIPSSLKNITSGVFMNCSGITSVIIPEGVETIGYGAFCGCTSLESVVLPQSLTSLGGETFYECSSLKTICVIGTKEKWDSVTKGDNWSYGTGEYTVKIIELLTEEEWKNAFASENFYNVTMHYNDEVWETLPDGTVRWLMVTQEYDGEYLRYRWSIDLKETPDFGGDTVEAVIKNSKEYIEQNNIYDVICTEELLEILSGYEKAYAGFRFDFATDSYTNGEISFTFFENGKIKSYSVDELTFTFEKYGATKVEPPVKTSEGLSYGLLSNNTYYVAGIGTCTDTDIVIPSTYNGFPVTQIYSYAFQNNSTITSVTVPESVVSIAYKAFCACKKLESVTILGGNTIGGWTFYNCPSLKTVTINDGVKIIEENAFACCSLLSSVTLPETLETVGNQVFYACTSLTDVTVPSGVTSLGDHIFYGCTSLASVTLYEGITKIPNYSFQNCTSLTSVIIPSGVTTVGTSAFSGCTALKSVTMPKSVTLIGQGAFLNCRKLASITFIGTEAEWSAVTKGQNWDKSAGAYTVNFATDFSNPDLYSGTYGYEYLGTLENGEVHQAFYTRIDSVIKAFHLDTATTLTDSTKFLEPVLFNDLGLTYDEAVRVYSIYKSDHPLYYWISNSWTHRWNNESECLVPWVDGDYWSAEKRAASHAAIYESVAEYDELLKNENSEYGIALIIRDSICAAVDYTYEEDGVTPSNARWAHNILGVLTKQGAVCEAYAETFQLLLNFKGVENIYVMGIANNGRHAWNLVKLDDGKWYWCDITWDDVVNYYYFCVPETASFTSSHIPYTPESNTPYDRLYTLPERATAKFEGAKY